MRAGEIGRKNARARRARRAPEERRGRNRPLPAESRDFAETFFAPLRQIQSGLIPAALLSLRRSGMRFVKIGAIRLIGFSLFLCLSHVSSSGQSVDDTQWGASVDGVQMSI